MSKFNKCAICPQTAPSVMTYGGVKDGKVVDVCYMHYKNPKEVVERSVEVEKVKTGIAKRSDKRKVDDKEYYKRRKKFLKENPLCLANVNCCTKKAEDIHHKKGRVGDNYLDVSTFLPVCRNCHTWAEIHPEEAKELGISESRLNVTI